MLSCRGFLAPLAALIVASHVANANTVLKISVVDTKNVPLAGALIESDDFSAPVTSTAPEPVEVSDARGRGEYTHINVTLAGFALVEDYLLLVTSDTEQDVVIVLKDHIDVTIRCKDGFASASTGVPTPVVGGEVWFDGEVAGTTDANGDVVLTNVEVTNVHSVGCSAEGYTSFRRSRRFTHDGQVISFGIRPFIELDLRVVDGVGSPLEGAECTYSKGQPDDLPSDTVFTSGADGIIATEAVFLPNDLFEYDCSMEGFKDISHGMTIVDNGMRQQTIDVVLNMFVDVTIKVTDSQGNALSGVKVDIRAGRDSAVHYTDDNGAVEISDVYVVNEGLYVEFTKDGYLAKGYEYVLVNEANFLRVIAVRGEDE